MTQPISAEQREAVYQKELHISWKKPEGSSKLVILNLNDGDFFSLEDPVSIGIWEGLMAGRTPANVLVDLQQTYPAADPTTVGRDMDAFIGELCASRLICRCQQATAST
jgi:hypothetical protein